MEPALGRAAISIRIPFWESLGLAIKTWWPRFRVHLHDRRFWVVQALVAFVTIGHGLSELVGGHRMESIYFVPATFYFFPVVYASLSFGREGAMPTAVWAAALAIPNILLLHHGQEQIGEIFQMTAMIFLAYLVAGRVDEERKARREAEDSEHARALSDLKYRALFEGAGEAILVLSRDGVVHEANDAAIALLGEPVPALKGAAITGLVGPEAGRIVNDATDQPSLAGDIDFRRPDGSEAWLQIVARALPSGDSSELVQVLLRDVSERRAFQDYAREIVRAQEDERQRIAQELHDVSLQSAILICRRLDAAAEATNSWEPHALNAALADARHVAELMGDDLRRFSRDLRPLILEDLGLVPALKRLVVELGQRSATRTRLNVVGRARRLDERAELCLFRVAQEALRNAERHSGASRVTVRVAFQPTAVKVSIVDNGHGFDVPSLTSLAHAGRLGLLGMQERARLIGGACHITSVSGRGTRVEVDVPASQ